MKCDFCSNDAFAVVRTKLAVDIEKEHNVCKECYKKMSGREIVKKL
ncbi:MAG: hypothetical protein ACUVRA_07145 [Candidatus Bathyarchaeaceae archaeon]